MMSVSNDNQLPSHGKIWIRYVADAGAGKYGLMRSPADFYNRSRYCQKMYVDLPSADVLLYKGAIRFSTELSASKTTRVLLLPFPKASILHRRIKSFDELYRFMLMVEELQLDVVHLQESTALAGWIVELSAMFDGLFRANSKMFEGIDTDFAKMHFPEPAQPNNENNQGNYELPAMQPGELKAMIPYQDAVPQPIFDTTVALCMANVLRRSPSG